MRMDCKSGPLDRPCVSPRRPNSTNAQTLRHAVASSGRRVSSVSAEDRKSPAAAVHCLRSSGPPRLVGTIAQTPPYRLFASRHRCAIPTTARCAPLATSGETGQFSNLPGDRHLRSPVPRPSPAPRPPLARVSPAYRPTTLECSPDPAGSGAGTQEVYVPRARKAFWRRQSCHAECVDRRLRSCPLEHQPFHWLSRFIQSSPVAWRAPPESGRSGAVNRHVRR